MKSIKLVFSSIISSIVAVIFITIITIGGELSVPLKNWLKNLTGHHWVSKGVIMLLIYVISLGIFYLIFKNLTTNSINKALKILNWLVVLGVLAILGFFTWHYLVF